MGIDLATGNYTIQGKTYPGQALGQAPESPNIVGFPSTNGSLSTNTHTDVHPSRERTNNKSADVTFQNVGSGKRIRVGPDGFLVAGPEPYVFRLTQQVDGSYVITDPGSGHVVTLGSSVGTRIKVAPAVPGSLSQVFNFFPRQ